MHCNTRDFNCTTPVSAAKSEATVRAPAKTVALGRRLEDLESIGGFGDPFDGFTAVHPEDGQKWLLVLNYKRNGAHEARTHARPL